jgi:hypothetical protein
MLALDHKIDTLISHMQTLQTVFPLTGAVTFLSESSFRCLMCVRALYFQLTK